MRLVTRPDFDGLAWAVLLGHVKRIESIQFVHPNDLQHSKFTVTRDDVLTNVPFVPSRGRQSTTECAQSQRWFSIVKIRA